MESIHDFYTALGFAVFSGFTLEAKKNKDGVWKKHLPSGLTKGWNTFKHGKPYNRNTDAFAIITGETSGIVVIDVDDPSVPHNARLMELMEDCTMVQQTKNGFHYVYKYDDRIPQSKADDTLKLDVRSGDLKNARGVGCIFCEPTRLTAADGTIVADYKWVKMPSSADEILPLPDAVVEELNRIRPNYYTTIKTEQQTEEEEVVSVETTASVVSTQSNPVAQTDTTLLTKLAASISNCEAYTDWLNNGIICFNEGLPLSVWEQMTLKHYPTYKKGSKRDCAAKWKTFAISPNRKLTQASWWKWLKDNDYIKYTELCSQRDDNVKLYRLINHKEFATIFYNLNPNAYLFHDRMGWFQINSSNIWKHYPNKEPEQILSRVSDCLMKYTEDVIEMECNRYARERSRCTDPEKGKELLKIHRDNMSLYEKGHQSFGSAHFCKGMLCFLPALYYRETLEEEMNMAAHLFAFSDGKCVDLKLGKVRDIEPTDYISQTTGYACPSYKDDEVRSKLREFLFGLYENEAVLQYVLRVFASCLYGENKFHKFFVFTGSGGNGKGMIATLLQSVFGDYYHTVDITLFTKPRERADQPCPALVDARYKRMMMTTEPEKDDEFQKGLLKKISGGDLIEARTLFSKDIIRYKPQFKLICQTNAIPKIKLDDGVGRRMEVVDFPFKFRPAEECTTEKHRVANPAILHEICMNPAVRDEFIIWLLEIHEEIKGLKSLQPPAEVKDATGSYFDDNNPYKFWLDEKFDITGSAEDRIPAYEMQSYYCQDRNIDKVKLKTTSFAQGLLFNGIEKKRGSGGFYYIGVKRKNPLGTQNESCQITNEA